MDLVDLNVLIEFMFYDDKTQSYKKVRGTIREFLQIFTDYKNIPLYTVNNTLLGEKYEEVKRTFN